MNSLQCWWRFLLQNENVWLCAGVARWLRCRVSSPELLRIESLDLHLTKQEYSWLSMYILYICQCSLAPILINCLERRVVLSLEDKPQHKLPLVVLFYPRKCKLLYFATFYNFFYPGKCKLIFFVIIFYLGKFNLQLCVISFTLESVNFNFL